MKMAQHIVTVCVVCVLCAAHVKCFAHTSTLPVVKQTTTSVTAPPGYSEHLLPNRINSTVVSYSKSVNAKDSKGINNKKHSINKVPEDRKSQISPMINNKLIEDSEPDRAELESRDKELMERLGQNQLESLRNSELNAKNFKNSRAKRSSDEKYFTKKIFALYGDGENMTMEGFEKLLKKLRLFQSEAEDSNHSAISKESKNHEENHSSSKKQTCLSSTELLSALSDDTNYKSTKVNTTQVVPGWLFEKICPALVYQSVVSCISVPDDFKSSAIDTERSSHNMFQVWVYSTVSILIISLCGLLGVAVIPVMGKSYYQQLLQFLVALAVGTLCGDALIHLLPHAMMPDHSHSDEHSHIHLVVDHSEDVHSTNMWKGFVAVIGLVLFFFTEKALNIIAEWKRYNQSRIEIPARVRVMRESDAGSSNTVGEKLCKHKYSTYPYCYGEIATETHDNLHSHQHNNHERPQTIEEEKPLTCNSNNCNSISNKIMPHDLEKKNNDDWKVEDTVISDAKKAVDGTDIPMNDAEAYTVIIREHETKHHGHGHTHSHVHSTPDSMSSVAWMVVMGDGLHNFTDGMAIGAAFSANIAGGFSTTIAVFCHELPHELGDFAVLLKAGMSAKQAVFYNLLSSILCLFGMVFGVLLGSTPEASSWMFAAAAGMFIYIALVDMVPEMSTNHSLAHGALCNCFLQASGLICGFGIMLTIALYEDDLKHLFNG